jgi:hypothetical protein
VEHDHEYDVYNGETVHRDDCKACLAGVQYFLVIRLKGGKEVVQERPYSTEIHAHQAGELMLCMPYVEGFEIIARRKNEITQ